jgi:trehalose 6-phosphate phosphatase
MESREAHKEAGALPPPPVVDLATIALFVDIDGTLLDIAPRPDAVIVEPTLRSLLRALHARLGGALVPISGRTLVEIDALLGLPIGVAAGTHGVQLRDGTGHVSAAPKTSLAAARGRAHDLAATIPGVLLEDKDVALALHYRSAPEAEAAVRSCAREMLKDAGPDFELLDGSLVVELKERRANKGSSLLALMSVPPLVGRIPWVVGDDITDEDAFVQANAMGGNSIVVGSRRPTAARHALESPAAVRAWLELLVCEGKQDRP